MADNIIELARAELANIRANSDPLDMVDFNNGFIFEDDQEEEKGSKISFSSASKLAENASPPTYLINKILEIDSHGILAGASQAFKSFMALELAYCLATGSEFFEYKTFHSHKVIYVCGEGHGALGRRLRALSIVKNGLAENLLIMDQKMFLDIDADVDALSLEIQKMRPSLVIFDTFSSMNSRTNENDNSEVGAVLAKIQRSIANGFTSSLIVHHFGKDAERGVRGAYAFQGNTDFVMIMEREADKGMGCKLSSIKMKDSETFDDIHCIARHVDLGLMNQDGSNSTSLVLDLVSDNLDQFRPEKNAKFNELNSIFYKAFIQCLEDDPISFGDKIGVKRKYFCVLAKNMVGKNSEYIRVSLSKYINSGIFEEIPLKINNILVLK